MTKVQLMVSIMLVSASLSACNDGLHPRMVGLCDDPAPLNGAPDPKIPSDFIVIFPAGVDAQVETGRLEELCGFEAELILELTPGFNASLSSGALECVRCDPAVESVTYNHIIYPASDGDGLPNIRLQAAVGGLGGPGPARWECAPRA